jgi:hypothetical protein
MTIHLLLDSVEACADCHWLDITSPIDACKVTSRLTQSLIEAPLQLLSGHNTSISF